MRRSILLSIALLAMLPAIALNLNPRIDTDGLRANAPEWFTVAIADTGVFTLDTWIDTDFDGLPANTPQDLTVGVPDSFDIYVDLTNFPFATWTNFLYAFSVGPGPDSSTNFFANDTGSVVVTYPGISGITPFAENNFDLPYVIQIGGFGAPQNVVAGPFKLATVTVTPIRPAPSASGCITPRIASDNPLYLETSFGNSSAGCYGTFQNGTRTAGCYTITAIAATEATSWGKLKGLYR